MKNIYHFINIILFIILVLLIIWISQTSFIANKLDLDMTKIDNKDLLAFELKRFDWIIAIFGTFMTVIVLSFTIVSFLQQKQYNKEVRELIDTSINEFKSKISDIKENSTNHLEKEINNYNRKFESAIETIPEKVKKLVDDSFNDFKHEYERRIFADTKRFTREAFMIIPEYHKRVDLKLRNSINELKKFFKICFPSLKDESVKNMFDELHKANTNLHTLSRLFSPDEDQKLSGLRDLAIIPFIEIEPFVKTMEQRYIDDPKLYPAILDALDSIRKLKANKVRQI
ncbi:MAG: hypothetical protein R2764_25715 [Bacteroidales bacterium]